MALGLNTSVKELYGVGAARAKAYARLGIHDLRGLITHYPRRYENRGDVRALAACDGGERCSFILTVATEPKGATLKGRMSILKFRAFDDSASCEITYFNQSYLKSVFTPGLTFRFYGKLEKKGSKYFLGSPTYEPYSESVPLPPLVPIYPSTEGLSQKQIAKDIATAIGVIGPHNISDALPEDIRLRNSLCTYSYAIGNIHRPESYAALATAKKRLMFDEFFMFSLGLSLTRAKKRASPAPACADVDTSPLTSLLPYALTGAQRRVISEISSDMSRPEAMSRIVVGDVGCGKTVCAAAAIYIAVKNGYQAALMAPTEILALQHFGDLSPLFEKLGIRCALLTSSVTKAKKQKIYEALANGECDVAIGTQALLSEGVAFKSPALVVTDEQHRFGVNQRALLSQKGGGTHVLVMSATPIPRSMALALYGDLDLSLIDEMPAGRQRVDTFVVDSGYRERLERFIEKQVAEGGQVYVVCPAIESEEDDEGDISIADINSFGEIKKKPKLRSAIEFSEELASRFSNLAVDRLHGKMKYAEKDEVMRRFAEGKTDILVSTTVIEVGVNVPNASLMIVENAERFGLSQLHQLRGRVGRGKRKSYCVLVSDAEGDSSRERLQTMHTTYNGFEIAEKDLAMRGPGDFLGNAESDGIRQSGEVGFRLGALCDDTGLLELAFSEARGLFDSGNGFADYPALAASVCEMFTIDFEVIS